MEQNFWLDPPVVRGVNVRPHHRQGPSGVGFRACSSAGVGKPPPFMVIAATDIDEAGNSSANSKVSIIQPVYHTRSLAQEIEALTFDQLSGCRKPLEQ